MSALDRIVEVAEERLGVTFMAREEADALRESAYAFEEFREEATELAYHALDHFSGRKTTMARWERVRLARRSRTALERDPIAGAEADLLANFSFGKGIGLPTAKDPDVQEVIEEAWTDSGNEAKLTGFEAQRHRSHQLLTDANLFPAAFVRNGRVRIGFLDADRVVDIICDPDDEERPLYYVYDEPLKATFDFNEDRWRIPGENAAGGKLGGGGTTTVATQGGFYGSGVNLRYYPHWRNVEDLRRERKANGEPPFEEPPEDKLGKGLVHHVRINRIGMTQFGTPPWARTLRFMSAMNEVVEAHVAMAQAASSFIAKRVIKGGPEQITKAANSILSQTGEIAAARFGTGVPPPDLRGKAPAAPGSFWLENEQHRLESLQLQPGASQAQETVQIVRAPMAASSGFGQHYLGDASNANLATATSLELPTLMTVQAWQETLAQMYRWFTDVIIQEAVRAGRLGGEAALPSERATPLAELCLREAADQQEAESRTGRDLSYSFSMPYPGRRNLPDVTALVTGVATAYDPGGSNIPLRRKMLLFLATHGLQEEDPRAWVDEVLPEEVGEAQAMFNAQQQQDAALTAQAAQDQAAQQAQQAQQQADAQAAAVPAGGGGDPTANGDALKNGPQSQLQAALEELGVDVDVLFMDEVIGRGNG